MSICLDNSIVRLLNFENADKDMNTDKPRKYSQKIVDGAAQAPSRSMLRAVGLGDEDFKKSQVGIASTWSMVTPCNMHINTLAEEVGKGVDGAGAKSVIYNTFPIPDGFPMGPEAMNNPLVSREVICDPIEALPVAMGHAGMFAMGGCDPTYPGRFMALARSTPPPSLPDVGTTFRIVLKTNQ